MEAVTILEFADRITRNKEYRFLKDTCGEFKIFRKSLKTYMQFKTQFHRYATNKEDGHKAFYIAFDHKASKEAIEEFQNIAEKVAERLNRSYLENKVNAKAAAIKANKEGSEFFGKYIAFRVDCYNWTSKEWLNK